MQLNILTIALGLAETLIGAGLIFMSSRIYKKYEEKKEEQAAEVEALNAQREEMHAWLVSLKEDRVRQARHNMTMMYSMAKARGSVTTYMLQSFGEQYDQYHREGNNSFIDGVNEDIHQLPVED